MALDLNNEGDRKVVLSSLGATGVPSLSGFDLSTGVFPVSAAEAGKGATYLVTGAGTVNGVDYVEGESLVSNGNEWISLDAPFSPPPAPPTVEPGGGVSLQDVADNAAKLDLTGISAGHMVRVTTEGGRIEQFTGGDPSVEENWGRITDTYELSINRIAKDFTEITVNGVTCAPMSVTSVGWLRVGDPISFAHNAASFSPLLGYFSAIGDIPNVLGVGDYIFESAPMPSLFADGSSGRMFLPYYITGIRSLELTLIPQ